MEDRDQGLARVTPSSQARIELLIIGESIIGLRTQMRDSKYHAVDQSLEHTRGWQEAGGMYK